METKIAYFVNRIQRSLDNHDYMNAKMYYDKSVLSLGNVDQIAAFKPTIENGIKNAKPVKQNSENKEVRKKKTLNEALIIVPIMLVLIVGYLVYYSINIYPEKRLRDEFYRTWYQGNVSGGMSSDGVYLTFREQADETYEIQYRRSGGTLIASFECEVINGEKITIDGYPIQVKIEDDLITFRPSFVDTSDWSVWRSNREYDANDKTGNFDENNTSHGESTTIDGNTANGDNTPNGVNAPNGGNTSNDGNTSNGSNTSNDGNTSNGGNTSNDGNTSNGGNTSQQPASCSHNYADATCTTPKTCTLCGETSGSALGHTYSTATCTEPQTCSCGATTGSAAGHKWTNITQTVHHEEQGHYEDVQDAKKVQKYKCWLCSSLYETKDAYYAHFDSAHGNEPNSSYFRERYEMVEDWVYETVTVWVVDREAYTETVVTGRKCDACGKIE